MQVMPHGEDMTTTLTHTREELEFHVFEWAEPDESVHRFYFDSYYVVMKLAMGHLMRGCVWGRA